MVPTTRNLLHHDGKNTKSCYPSPSQYCVGITAQLEASVADARQDHHDPSTRSLRLTMADDDELAAAATTSSHGGVDTAGRDGGGNWLQLGLAAASSSSSASSSGDNNTTDPSAAPTPVQLGLFTCGYDDKRHARMRPELFPLPLRSYQQYGHGRRSYQRQTAASGSMSAPFLPFMPPFIRSDSDVMRVISPPRRTEATGLWLTLTAAPNQCREPILPQIPKSYLRIKDSSIKVEVVMKYLSDKLGLARPHQVELTCRGQVLPPFLLVKYVRDNIWCSSSSALVSREGEAACCALADERPARRRSPSVATTDHVMTLCYTTSRNRTLLFNL